VNKSPTPSGSPIAPASTFLLSGIAHEVAPNAHSLPGVLVTVTAGPPAGTSVTSDAMGVFRFPALPDGTIAVEASKAGYIGWKVSNWPLDADRAIEVALFPTPPVNAAGASATARCNDGTWSWDASPALACAAGGGVAYDVCPGPFCDQR
jgi:hypothetical protein